MLLDRAELTGEVGNRRIDQGLGHSVDHAAVLAILPFRQTRDDAGSNRLQLTQLAVGMRRRCPGRGFKQFTIFANVRRIDRVSLVTSQLGAREVPNLGRIDDADDMSSLRTLNRSSSLLLSR